MQKYFLDSATLLAILSRQKRSGTLSAYQITIPNIGGDVSISIVFEHGVIQDCNLIRKQQIILRGKSAYHVVETLPTLKWIWQPLQAPLSPPPPGVSPAEKNSVASPLEKNSEDLEKGGRDYPQQTAGAQNKGLLQRLSRRHRQVLLLCDGTRSLSKIAAILSMSPQNLSPLVDDLKIWGCIRFRQEL